MGKSRKLTVQETIDLLVTSGSKLGQKTGAILTPVSWRYWEAMERQRLRNAYLNTTYWMYNLAIDTRIDKENRGLAATLQQVGHTQWAFLKDWKTFSK